MTARCICFFREMKEWSRNKQESRKRAGRDREECCKRRERWLKPSLPVSSSPVPALAHCRGQAPRGPWHMIWRHWALLFPQCMSRVLHLPSE